MSARKRIVGLAAALLCFYCSASSGAEPAGSVRCRRVGRGDVAGPLMSLSGGNLVLGGEGGERRFELTAFRALEFRRQEERGGTSDFLLWAADRGLYRASGIERAGEDRLSLAGQDWSGEDVPLESLRAVATGSWLEGADDGRKRDFRRARSSPPAGSDLIAVSRQGERRRARGVVRGLSSEGVHFSADGRETEVPWDRVDWLVLSGAGGQEQPAVHGVELTDGSVLPATDLRLEGSTLHAEGPGGRFRVSAGRLRRMDIASDRYLYLSQLEPSRVQTEPFLDVVWRPRMDECVAGGAIRLGGRRFSRGIGMHTRTAMSFKLSGSYRTLHATVGVDDRAGPRGHVIFRVLTDGGAAGNRRVVLETEPQTGADEPLRVEADISGAAHVTLLAEFGSPVDPSGNLADWAEVRVVR